jgi:hypothetical protein
MSFVRQPYSRLAKGDKIEETAYETKKSSDEKNCIDLNHCIIAQLLSL